MTVAGIWMWGWGTCRISVVGSGLGFGDLRPKRLSIFLSRCPIAILGELRALQGGDL